MNGLLILKIGRRLPMTFEPRVSLSSKKAPWYRGWMLPMSIINVMSYFIVGLTTVLWISIYLKVSDACKQPISPIRVEINKSGAVLERPNDFTKPVTQVQPKPTKKDREVKKNEQTSNSK